MIDDQRLHDAAIEMVARHVLATAARGVGDDGFMPAWDDYPELSEDDWHRVCLHVQILAKFPSRREYHWAYGDLVSRAERVS